MKKAACLLVALLILFVLVSCRHPSGGETVSGEPQSSGSVDTTSSENLPTVPSSTPSASENSDGQASQPSSSDGASSAPASSEETPSDTQKPTTDPLPVFTPLAAEEYHYYKNLTLPQKAAYNKMYEAVLSMPGGYISLGEAELLSETDVYLAATALKGDRPEIFWLPYAWYIGETSNGQMAILFANQLGDEHGNIESYEATYVVGRGDRDRMAAELAAAVKEIKALVTASTPYEIELQLHDILAERITYSAVTPARPLDHTAYGALVGGEAVCEGYSRALQLLLYEYGINSTLVTGYAGGPHMWNQVLLEGKWYHLDLTWNDGEKALYHRYFNLTDTEISRDHTINADYSLLSADDILGGEPFNLNLAAATDTKQNYFVKSGFIYEKNPDSLAEKIAAADFGKIEVKGFSEEAKTALIAALTARGFNKELNYNTEGDWALITLANLGG